MSRILCQAALFTSGLLITALSASAEERQVYSVDSPAWMRAVGKLTVPGSRYENGRYNHHHEDCSATLVSLATRNRADTIITAWHCIEYYGDLSKPILFTLPGNSGQDLTREVYRVFDGGSMHADWAILKMHQAISTNSVAAVMPHSGRANPAKEVSMAGYSRDAGLGNGGEHLTYDEGCKITLQANNSSDTDCIAHKGASGGAVIQLSEQGAAHYIGVISRGDGDGVSIFVPTEYFRGPLRRALE